MEPEHLHAFPADPEIISPLHETRVLGHHVVLRWSPLDGADAYRVEVARDTHFDDLVVQQETTETHLDLSKGFPADGQTYYWRVQGRQGDQYSRGEGIESFIAMKGSEMPDAPAGTPPEDEDKGPVVELLKATGTEAAAEATGADVAKDAEARLGVEHEGIEAGQILGFVVALLISVAVIAIIMFNWTDLVAQEARSAAAAQVPGISATAVRYPRLYETEMKARRAIDHYEMLNDQTGTYRIPIGEAMTLMTNERMRTDSAAVAAPGMTQEMPDMSGR